MASQSGLPMQDLDLGSSIRQESMGNIYIYIYIHTYIAACGVETLGGALGPTQAALSGDSNGLIHTVHVCKRREGAYWPRAIP